MMRMLRIKSVGTGSVLSPYCLRLHPYSVHGVRIVSQPTKLGCGFPPSLRRKYGYSTDTVCIQHGNTCVNRRQYVEGTDGEYGSLDLLASFCLCCSSRSHKAVLKKMSCFSVCGPTRCSSSMKISGSTLRKFLKLVGSSVVNSCMSFSYWPYIGLLSNHCLTHCVLYRLVLRLASLLLLSFFFVFVLQVLLSGT